MVSGNPLTPKPTTSALGPLASTMATERRPIWTVVTIKGSGNVVLDMVTVISLFLSFFKCTIVKVSVQVLLMELPPNTTAQGLKQMRRSLVLDPTKL